MRRIYENYHLAENILFWQQLLKQSDTQAQEVPYTAAVPLTLETRMEIQASQNRSLRADTG